jgi:hypothetical protein
MKTMTDKINGATFRAGEHDKKRPPRGGQPCRN